MSRVRFHGIDAIKRYPGVCLKKTGPGWKEFKSVPQMEQQFKPDLIIWYKPLGLPGFSSAKTPKCLRYNEMWDRTWTKHEIKDSNSKLVICHHYNDIEKFAGNLSPEFKLVHNPHCGEIDIFKDYGQKKDVDVLIVGKDSRSVYPLRYKLARGVKHKLQNSGIKVQVYKHPGYSLSGYDAIKRQCINYARAINRAKIVVSDASVHCYALAKYVEVPLCNAALAADLPRENEGWYRKWMIPLSKDYDSNKLAEIIKSYLNDPAKLAEVTKAGYEMNIEKRKQEDYARRFVKLADDFLGGKMDDYDFGRSPERYYNAEEGIHE